MVVQLDLQPADLCPRPVNHNPPQQAALAGYIQGFRTTGLTILDADDRAAHLNPYGTHVKIARGKRTLADSSYLPYEE